MRTIYYHIELFEGEDAKWYWRIRSYNNNILAVSEGYESKQSAKEVAERLQSHLEFSVLDIHL
jgi:uncharacterized protein YegP (UPF0339 family)